MSELLVISDNLAPCPGFVSGHTVEIPEHGDSLENMVERVHNDSLSHRLLLLPV